MSALFVNIPTMLRQREIRSFSADSKYSADHIPILRFPHLCFSTLGSRIDSCHKQTLEIENDFGVPFPV